MASTCHLTLGGGEVQSCSITLVKCSAALVLVMFYSNVKKLCDLPASPFGFLKNFCRREDKVDYDGLEFKRDSPGRRSLRSYEKS